MSETKNEWLKNWPPVYLHSIFEISSVTWIFFNFKISSLKNWKINLISKLIFAGYTGSKNQVQTRKKIKLVLNSIFFQVWNNLRNPKLENRVQRDRADVWWQGGWVGLAKCWREQKIYKEKNFFFHAVTFLWAFFFLCNSQGDSLKK